MEEAGPRLPAARAGLPVLALDAAAGLGAAAFAGLVLSTLRPFLGLGTGGGVVAALVGGAALAYAVTGPHPGTRRLRAGVPLLLLGAGVVVLLVRLVLPGGPGAIAGYAAAVAGAVGAWAGGAPSLAAPAAVPAAVLLGCAAGLPLFAAARAGRPAVALLLGFSLLVIEWEFVDNGTVHVFWPLVGVALFWLASDRAREAAAQGESATALTAPWAAFLPAVVAGLAVAAVLALVPRQGGPANLGRLGVWIDEVPVLGTLEKATREGNLGYGPPIASRSGSGAATGPGAPGATLRSGGFSLQQTGFSEQVSNLGGPAAPDHNPALRISVSGSGPLPSVLYLRGAVRDIYTGRGWIADPAAEGADPGFAATSAGQIGRDFLAGTPLPAPYTLISAHITLEGAASANLFTALLPMRLPVSQAAWDQDGEVWLPTAAPSGYSYNLTAAVLSPTVWDGTSFVAYAFPGLGGRVVSPQAAIGLVQSGQSAIAEPGPPAEASTGTLPLASDLELPGRTPAAVARLARAWTAGLNGDPLLQALAVQDHLRHEYTYTLRAPVVPAGADFVAYFLFTAHRGYCTSFSSAMVVMLRTLGIPARWVEGYRVALPPQGGTFVVPDNAAHAWVEAYIAPYGWLTFDPTPSRAPPLAAAPGSSARGNGRLGLLQSAAPLRWWFAVALPAALLLLLAGSAAVNAWEERRPSGSAAAAAQAVWRSCERVGARHGRPRHPAETPAEYLEALAARFPAGAAAAAAVAAEYGALCFGEGEPEDARWLRAGRLRAHWDELMGALRAANPWTFPLRRWL